MSVDEAAANRSISTIRLEVDFLLKTGLLNQAQYQSIVCQLPQSGRAPSNYIDPRYSEGPQNYVSIPNLTQAAQDPNHPANPQHPKHGAWAKKLGEKLGNAAIFGAGATAGSDLVNSIF